MKFLVTVLATLSLVGCSREGAPPSPLAPSSSVPDQATALQFHLPPAHRLHSTWVWAMVVDEDGICIEGATIEVVRGQRRGERIEQVTPCDVWADWGGVIFDKVISGAPMLLRGSAPGFAAQDMVVTPHEGGQRAVVFTPTRIR